MSYKSVNPNQKEFVVTRKWKDWKEGEFVIGTKIECNEKDKFKKPIYALMVKQSNFGHEVGTPIYLNAGGNFVALIDMVEEGEECKIVYNGMSKIKKGEWAGSMTYNIDVQMSDMEAEAAKNDSDAL